MGAEDDHKRLPVSQRPNFIHLPADGRNLTSQQYDWLWTRINRSALAALAIDMLEKSARAEIHEVHDGHANA